MTNKDLNGKASINIFRKDGDKIYEDKIEPSIYTFYSEEFNKLNNFYSVKFGDTKRSVQVRLGEWRDKIIQNK